MNVFYLKRGDTRPILEVQLKNPDGTIHDLTGSTDWRLNIYVADHVMTRLMTKVDPDTAGLLRYAWLTTDWGPGGLPALAPAKEKQYRMEYEVLSGGHRMTFPNDRFDYLQLTGDLDQT